MNPMLVGASREIDDRAASSCAVMTVGRWLQLSAADQTDMLHAREYYVHRRVSTDMTVTLKDPPLSQTRGSRAVPELISSPPVGRQPVCKTCPACGLRARESD